MKKIILCFLVLFSFSSKAQTDFSDSWEDFFSYNNVKDFVKVGDLIYALSENALFTYSITSQETQKLSSVQGLSGETTTAIHFSTSTNRLVIGYENGLLEIVDNNGRITASTDIINFNQTGEKSINNIHEENGILYLSTSFAVIEYDINRLEFGDTFFIGNNSTDVTINEITVFNDRIYAATDEGIFHADINDPNLIDFNNWTQIVSGTNQFENITVFNNRLFTILNRSLFEIVNNTLVFTRNFSQNVTGMKESTTHLTIALGKSLTALDTFLNVAIQNNADSNFDYDLNNALVEGNELYLGTQQFGILSSFFANPSNFLEIHPEGPISNDVFSVAAQNDNAWVVYGGYAANFSVIGRNLGFSHYNGENWLTTNFSSTLPFPDLVDVTIDPTNENRVFISGFGDSNLVNTINVGGLMEVVDDEIVNFYTNLNSDLEDIIPTDPTRTSIRVSSSAFDSRGDLWLTNIGVPTELKKFSEGTWSSFDISSVKVQDAFGLTEVAIDRSNNIWIGTRGDGAIVFNENGNRIRALSTTSTQGSLPNANVRSIAVDTDNRIWIGTISGLVVFNNASGVFDADVVDAQPIIFLEDGIARRLLDEEIINTIAVDGANNKWFGTENGGVVYTNPNGQTTLETFNTNNSPLPSNTINKIAVDESTGRVYFATDQGVVVFNSNVSPFGDVLGEVYAYPNPVRSFHNTVTIDGRNGTSLPRGTNVKILDVAGNLVFETNVIEGQELQGGKVVWDKTNLAGRKVASGVYIVLLANEDASETSTTKIAIIN